MSTSEDKWETEEGGERWRRLCEQPEPSHPEQPPLRKRLEARRDELQSLLDMHKQEFARREIELVELRRSMDALHGGIEELNRLLASDLEP